ncbi:hypothetical protein [Laspinema olomoucense]|uniref:hypothetical protein n=1 Tax=Laspinema olomoucense TaxID=3231600 RepID=UPI0021BB483A|nr:hypothetical protein [Laspinema sp. D3c]
MESTPGILREHFPVDLGSVSVGEKSNFEAGNPWNGGDRLPHYIVHSPGWVKPLLAKSIRPLTGVRLWQSIDYNQKG